MSTQTTTTYTVTGMTCGHCVSAVSEELGKVAGVREVAIDLVTDGVSPVRVTSDAPLAEAVVRDAIDEAGYELVDVPA